jgi:hypothetical protein
MNCRSFVIMGQSAIEERFPSFDILYALSTLSKNVTKGIHKNIIQEKSFVHILLLFLHPQTSSGINPVFLIYLVFMGSDFI